MVRWQDVLNFTPDEEGENSGQREFLFKTQDEQRAFAAGIDYADQNGRFDQIDLLDEGESAHKVHKWAVRLSETIKK
jgi:hypothetical protein